MKLHKHFFVFASSTLPLMAFSQSYFSQVLAANPVAYYQLNETTADYNASGGIANDSSGYGNTAFDAYGPGNGITPQQPSAPGLGTSYNFDGSGDYLITDQLGGSSATQLNGLNFTVQCWIQTTAQSLTSNDSNNSGVGTGFAFQGNGLIYGDTRNISNDFTLAELNNSISFNIGSNVLYQDFSITAATPVNDGGWHDVVATRQLTNGGSQISIYIDGTVAASAFEAGATDQLDSNPYIAFGGNYQDGRFFNGNMDEVALYNSVLTPRQIASQYAAGANPTPEPAPLAAFATALGLFGIRRRRIIAASRS